ncbi:MAG: 2-oxoacid:ferredoxin oxidoreductase subunit beta [Candidatus Azosocius agrarius]|nr:MAG: 2-oxoacid:ferredoxin oxidoreductase subunit beta [Gammaproteobacteria bacterium]
MENVFISNNEIKWCPGCGDYAILQAIQKAFMALNINREKIVIISGIGCASRLPYYVNTYGFHTIHGRAAAIATGLKITRPDLSIWIVIGDGDGLSIGLNHTIQILRKNFNINILLLNNQIYGLTKGQYSPTSPKGKITKSSPYGVLEEPINPIKMAFFAGATFIAREIDTNINNLIFLLKAAYEHEGTSFIEILQNCTIFNKDNFIQFKDKNLNKDTTLMLKHNSPLIFGENNNKKLILNKNLLWHISDYDSIKENNDIIIHDIYNENIISELLSNLTYPNFPIPLGIFKAVSKNTYEKSYYETVNNYNMKYDSENIYMKDQTWML